MPVPYKDHTIHVVWSDWWQLYYAVIEVEGIEVAHTVYFHKDHDALAFAKLLIDEGVFGHHAESDQCRSESVEIGSRV